MEIMLRGDGHYGTPEVMNVLEDMGCSYVLGLPTNARLKAIAAPWSEDAATRRAINDKDCVLRTASAASARPTTLPEAGAASAA